MKKSNVLSVLTSIVCFSGVAFAHPNGIYRLDSQPEVTVTFAFVGRCPAVQGAMPGGLRTLTFSEAAKGEPYSFLTGNYVETHVDGNEVYVNTDSQCVPTDPAVSIPATRNTFNGYSLERI